MKNNKKILLILGGLFLAASAFAQTLLPMTTLSAAVPSRTATFIQVASTTGITVNSYLYVDQEAMSVTSVPTSGTLLGVVRGAQPGLITAGGGRPHANGALVFIISPTASQFALPSTDPEGACARGNATLSGGVQQNQGTPYLPIIDTLNGAFYDCLGGVFVQGDYGLPPNTNFRILAPNSGGTAYTSLNSTGTTLVATTQYCTELDLPYNKYLTGLGVLNGTTVGTDKHLVALYDSSGNLLANSAVAGATSSGASTYQTFAFTTPYYAIGPAQYFACAQTNGTTDTIRMIVTGTQDTYLTKGITGQTFGTLVNIATVPTTFTTAVGPYFEAY